MTGDGKYRLRTWLRANLPYLLSDRIPKGPKDCGNHEWYRRDEDHWDCYHCLVGVKEVIREDPKGTPSPATSPPRAPSETFGRHVTA